MTNTCKKCNEVVMPDPNDGHCPKCGSSNGYTVSSTLKISYKIEDYTDELMNKQMIEWDEFSLYVRTHVYMQYYLGKAIEMMFPKNEELHKNVNFTTNIQLQILHGRKFLSNVMYHNCKIINKIRNDFAHTLEPNETSIQDQIKNMKIPWIGDGTKSKLTTREIYQMVSWAMIRELRNAIQQKRMAMFYPDETEYNSETKEYL